MSVALVVELACQSMHICYAGRQALAECIVVFGGGADLLFQLLLAAKQEAILSPQALVHGLLLAPHDILLSEACLFSFSLAPLFNKTWGLY
jgi:hypothetical protein